MNTSRKHKLPLHQVRRYLEPGPVVLLSSGWQGRRDIMTMGWHTVMEFSPSLVGCVIASSNHSFELVRGSGECVINLPERYNFFIWEVVAARVAPTPDYPETLHYRGDGRFMLSGRTVDLGRSGLK